MITTVEISAEVFQAFADATRLRLLNLLVERELCVCDLCTLLDEIQPKVSRHLATLRRAGLVTVRSDGKWKYYRAVRGAGPLRKTLLRCIKTCLREMEPLQEDLERLAHHECDDCC